MITYSTPAIERILGYQPEELVGSECMRLVHPEARQAAAEGWAGSHPTEQLRIGVRIAQPRIGRAHQMSIPIHISASWRPSVSITLATDGPAGAGPGGS